MVGLRKVLLVFVLGLACEPLEPFERSPADGGAQLPGADGEGIASGGVLVRRAIDGDTIVLTAGASLRAPDGAPLNGERVRLIGVDTPELSSQAGATQCFAEEALAFTRSALLGRLVSLEYDFVHGLRDDFDRLLAFVSIAGEVHNEVLVREGYARVYRQFSFRGQAAYVALESEARARGKGRWEACR